YGIDTEELENVKLKLKLSEVDGAVLVADRLEKAEKALKAVIERIIEALNGVPEETRMAKPDGTTRYMRPRPGAARLYPETDIPPVVVSEELIEKARKNIPPEPEQVVKNIISEYNINRKLAEQIVTSDYLELFKKIAKNVSIPPTFIASSLTETVKNLERRGIPVENLSDEDFLEIFKVISEGKTAKESFPAVVEWLAKNGGSVLEALEKLGLKSLTKEEIEKVVERKISENIQQIKSNPEKALDVIIRNVMTEFRGKVDIKVLVEVASKKLKNFS
ncbi:MAG: Glu-tRNA(Gln) amidotransferase GatDE subunit E, partial [Candidatus Bathyarchaeota archaeon]|nr:Glu-tRNA(Gln) amidotransferase GatDE subunit E [Candidatus Bathyarchaeota archaeon]